MFWGKSLQPFAQYKLGVMYHQGRGVPQGFTEAVKWFQKAAEQGLADAQYGLGFMYGNGQGVPRDYVDATDGLICPLPAPKARAIKIQSIIEI